MKKQEIIDKLMLSEYWSELYIRYSIKGMQYTTKKELLKELEK